MFVYFIQARNSKGPIKIGVAKDVERRLDSLQTANYQKLKIITVILCKSEANAYEMEKKLHHRFREYRIRGEWFSAKILKKWKG